ncbi:probable magnesium-chelatase subunit ChlD, chloroplastic at N-terminal half [Coccomyxa sp. Obi]|nr:probable magnesium-chelatase subunit ChlD, chloroplastic at N-terminal half [Coccomyxa sp. Obi]
MHGALLKEDAWGLGNVNFVTSSSGVHLCALHLASTARRPGPDQMSVISFCGDKAEVLLPPSKSITMAGRRLNSLPFDGGSPSSMPSHWCFKPHLYDGSTSNAEEKGHLRSLRISAAGVGRVEAVAFHQCRSWSSEVFSSREERPSNKTRQPEGMSQGGGGENDQSPQVVGPGDPAVQEEEVILKYKVPAAPPGAHTPRATGSDEYAPLDADAHVGPAGVTTGPAGKVPSAFEKISKRRMSATAMPPFARGFSSRIEVNPAGGHAVELDLQDDTKLVVDAAVEQFSNGQEYKSVGVVGFESSRTAFSTQARQNPPEVSRFDEHTTSQTIGFASGGQQNKAGQAQADSMGTGGFLNPPPGQIFDEAHTTPDIPMQGAPGTIKGAKLDSADADGALGGSKQTMAGHEQAEGMGTGGSLNPPPGETFTGGGLSSVGKDDSGSNAGKGAALKDPNYTVGADSSLPPGARGFFSAPAWFSAVSTAEHHQTSGAGAKKDSYEEVKHLPDCPEPVDAGSVTDLQTGVNVIGGTPVKLQAERMTHPDRLHRETESMQPETDPVIEKIISHDTNKLASRAH